MPYILRCPVCGRSAQLYRDIVIYKGKRLVFFGLHYSNVDELIVCSNSDKLAYMEDVYVRKTS